MAIKRESAIGFIFITLLLDVMGFGIIIPVMPDLISSLLHPGMKVTPQILSESAIYSGWMLFAFAIMQFLCSPIMGNLSDRYGRRPVLLFALFGFGIDYIILSIAPTIGWLFLGRILAGMTGASFTTASAYIADVSTPEKRAQNFGMIGMAFGLGFIIGPAIGGALSGLGLRAPFIAAAILSFLNCLYGYFILPESLKPENRRKFEWKRANPIGSLIQLKKYPVIFGLIGSLVCVYIAAHALQSTWNFITKEEFGWTPTMVGASLAFVGILIAGVQGGLTRVINPRLGQKRSVYFGLLLYIIGFILLGLANQTWMMFAFLVPYCLGGIAGPALQGIISNQVPANEQGELQGALTSLMSLTSIVGPLLMTNLFSYFTSKDAPFHYGGAPFIMGAILTIFSLFFAMRSLAGYVHLHDVPKNEPLEETVVVE